MPGEYIKCADLAGFIVGGDMDHRESLGGARHSLSIVQCMVLRLRQYPRPWHEPLSMRLERLEKERLDIGLGLTPQAVLFSLCSHFLRAGAMAVERLEETDAATEIECEIDDLIAEHGSERAAAGAAARLDRAAGGRPQLGFSWLSAGPVFERRSASGA
ncbi:hypothetical protein [Bosea sp. OK403]|uniref:hypothetical protein n=1 Tax=Bosea sp. OK403 TaxID=1855286 RepID=UPI001113B2BA|nr:hypothetical protein [Bosea sp. OK403]